MNSYASIFEPIRAFVSENRMGLSIASAVIASARLVHLVAADYSRWLALGPGGLPYNFYGYLKQNLIRPLGYSDLYSVLPYHALKSSKPLESRRFLPDLPHRQAPRPLVPNFAGPSRQATQAAPRSLIEASISAVKTVAVDNAAITHYGDSIVEWGGPALFTTSEAFAEAQLHERLSGAAEREYFHLHESEGSCHAFLSAADAEELVSKGWGQRHPLSGRKIAGWGLAAGYVTVYAPLEKEQVEIVRFAAKAALAYATDGKKEVC